MYRKVSALPRAAVRSILPAFLSRRLGLDQGEASTDASASSNNEEDRLTSWLADEEEEALLQARREVFEHVLVVRRGDKGEIVSVNMYRDVPRHDISLVLPDHALKMSSSEQVESPCVRAPH